MPFWVPNTGRSADRVGPRMRLGIQAPAMFAALCRAFYALSTPPLRRTVAVSLTRAVLTFALLWLAVAGVLYNTRVFDWRPLNWLVDLMGGLAILGLSWLFFPAVVTLIMSLFLERVAAAVEARDYPGSGPPRRETGPRGPRTSPPTPPPGGRPWRPARPPARRRRDRGAVDDGARPHPAAPPAPHRSAGCAGAGVVS